MREATAQFLAASDREHAKFDYEPDPRKLAELMGIRVIPGTKNKASKGPPALIQIARDLHVARWRFTLLHEINHVIAQREGLEDAIAAEVDEEDAEHHLEAVMNHGAARMIMPDPLVNIVQRMYGNTPEAIVNLAIAGQASLPAALHRFISSDVEAQRAAFITSGSYIAHVATCNTRLPFWRYERVPEIGLVLPEAKLFAVPKRLATCVGLVTC